MRELTELIAQRLVDHSEQVRVREVASDFSTILELSVADGELGMIIGKQGRTIHALRTILAAVAAKEGRRAVLEILE